MSKSTTPEAVDRAAIITGGAGGIGLATAHELAEAGFKLYLIDMAQGALGAALEALSHYPVDIRGVQADVTSPSAVTVVVAEAVAAFGRIDALVNIAGGAGNLRARDIEAFDLEAWDRVIALNVTSTFLMSRAVVPLMREQRYGRIVNLSSVAALGEKGPLTTIFGRLPYATAKAAVIGFTHQLAKDVGEHGITVNALLPGLIVGNQGTRVRDRFDGLDETARDRMTANWPFGRPGTPEEVARTIAFLVSEGASYVSGVALPVDGAYLGA